MIECLLDWNKWHHISVEPPVLPSSLPLSPFSLHSLWSFTSPLQGVDSTLAPMAGSQGFSSDGLTPSSQPISSPPTHPKLGLVVVVHMQSLLRSVFKLFKLGRLDYEMTISTSIPTFAHCLSCASLFV